MAADDAIRTRTVRVCTYNIHRGRGLDGRTRLERIAGVLAGIDADMRDVDTRRRQIGAQPFTEVILARLPATRRVRTEAGGGHRLVAALAAAFVVPGGADQRLVTAGQPRGRHHDVEVQAADDGDVDHAAP